MGILWQAIEIDEAMAAHLLSRADRPVPDPKRGRFRRRAARTEAPSVPADEVFSLFQGASHTVDLDKSWNALDVLLSDEPIGGAFEAILGGTSVSVDPDARVLLPAQVRAAADELARCTVESLRDRFDPVRMEREGVYPLIWDEEDVFEEYLAPHFGLLRDFYRDAAGRGSAVLITLG